MKTLICGLGILAAALLVRAQNNPASSQNDAVRQQNQVEQNRRELVPGDNVPALFEDEDADLGPQSILRQRKHRWFRISGDEQFYYTDNMFFESDDLARLFGRPEPVEAAVSVATLEAALQSRPCVTRFASYRAEAGYRHQFFNYFGDDEDLGSPGFGVPRLQLSDFDFDASTAFADVLAQTAHYQFRVGFEYGRLLGNERTPTGTIIDDDYTEFYRELVPRWSVQRNFRIHDRSQLSIAYLGSYHFTDEDELVFFDPGAGRFRSGFEDRSERIEHAALVSWSVTLPGDVVVQPYYRFQYTEFTELPGGGDEDEFLHTAGIGLGWYPCANFSARVFANYNWNETDSAFTEYEQFNGGGGVNVTFRF